MPFSTDDLESRINKININAEEEQLSNKNAKYDANKELYREKRDIELENGNGVFKDDTVKDDTGTMAEVYNSVVDTILPDSWGDAIRANEVKNGKDYDSRNKDAGIYDGWSKDALIKEIKDAPENQNAKNTFYSLRYYMGKNDDGSDKYFYKNGITENNAWNRNKKELGSNVEILFEKRFLGSADAEGRLNQISFEEGTNAIDIGKDKSSGTNYGSGSTELVTEDYFGLGNMSESRIQDNLNRSINFESNRKNHKRNQDWTDKALGGDYADALQYGAGRLAGGIVDMGATGLGFIFNSMGLNNNLSDTNWGQQMKDGSAKYFGYDEKSFNTAIAESTNRWNKGDYVGSITGDFFTLAEGVFASAPDMALMMWTGGGSKALQAAGKVAIEASDLSKAINVAKIAGDSAKVETLTADLSAVTSRLKSMPSGDKALKYAEANSLSKIVTNVSKQYGLLTITSNNTNNIIEDRIKNGDDDITIGEFAGIFASQFIATSIDKLSVKMIIGDGGLVGQLKSISKSLTSLEKKNLATKVAGASASMISSGSQEAAQEYMQTWTEILGKDLGVNGKSFYEVITDEKNIDEATGATLAGAVGGAYMHGAGSTFSKGKEILGVSKDKITSNSGRRVMSKMILSKEDFESEDFTIADKIMSIKMDVDEESDHEIDSENVDIEKVFNDLATSDKYTSNEKKIMLLSTALSAVDNKSNEKNNKILNSVSKIINSSKHESNSKDENDNEMGIDDFEALGDTIQQSFIERQKTKLFDAISGIGEESVAGSIFDNTGKEIDTTTNTGGFGEGNNVFAGKSKEEVDAEFKNSIQNQLKIYDEKINQLSNAGLDTKLLMKARNDIAKIGTNVSFSNKTMHQVSNEISSIGFLSKDGKINKDMQSLSFYESLVPMSYTNFGNNEWVISAFKKFAESRAKKRSSIGQDDGTVKIGLSSKIFKENIKFDKIINDSIDAVRKDETLNKHEKNEKIDSLNTHKVWIGKSNADVLDFLVGRTIHQTKTALDDAGTKTYIGTTEEASLLISKINNGESESVSRKIFTSGTFFSYEDSTRIAQAIIDSSDNEYKSKNNGSMPINYDEDYVNESLVPEDNSAPTFDEDGNEISTKIELSEDELREVAISKFKTLFGNEVPISDSHIEQLLKELIAIKLSGAPMQQMTQVVNTIQEYMLNDEQIENAYDVFQYIMDNKQEKVNEPSTKTKGTEEDIERLKHIKDSLRLIKSNLEKSSREVNSEPLKEALNEVSKEIDKLTDEHKNLSNQLKSTTNKLQIKKGTTDILKRIYDVMKRFYNKLTIIDAEAKEYRKVFTSMNKVVKFIDGRGRGKIHYTSNAVKILNDITKIQEIIQKRIDNISTGRVSNYKSIKADADKGSKKAKRILSMLNNDKLSDAQKIKIASRYKPENKVEFEVVKSSEPLKTTVKDMSDIEDTTISNEVIVPTVEDKAIEIEQNKDAIDTDIVNSDIKMIGSPKKKKGRKVKEPIQTPDVITIESLDKKVDEIGIDMEDELISIEKELGLGYKPKDKFIKIRIKRAKFNIAKVKSLLKYNSDGSNNNKIKQLLLKLKDQAIKDIKQEEEHMNSTSLYSDKKLSKEDIELKENKAKLKSIKNDSIRITKSIVELKEELEKKDKGSNNYENISYKIFNAKKNLYLNGLAIRDLGGKTNFMLREHEELELINEAISRGEKPISRDKEAEAKAVKKILYAHDNRIERQISIIEKSVEKIKNITISFFKKIKKINERKSEHINIVKQIDNMIEELNSSNSIDTDSLLDVQQHFGVEHTILAGAKTIGDRILQVGSKINNTFKASNSPSSKIADLILDQNSELSNQQIEELIIGEFGESSALKFGIEDIENIRKILNNNNFSVIGTSGKRTGEQKSFIDNDGEFKTNGKFFNIQDVFSIDNKDGLKNFNSALSFALSFSTGMAVNDMNDVRVSLLSMSDEDLLKEVSTDNVFEFRKMLSEGKIPLSSIEKNITKSIISILGLKFNDGISMETRDMFLAGISSMVKATLSNNSNVFESSIETIQSHEDGTIKKYTCIRYKSKISNDMFDSEVDLRDGLSSLSKMSFLIGSNNRSAPTFKPSRIKENILNSRMKISKKDARYLKKLNKKTWNFIPEIDSLVEMYREDRQSAYNMLGFKTEDQLSKMNIEDYRTTVANNDAVVRQVDSLVSYRQSIGRNRRFHLPFGITKPGRAMITSDLNPMESKIHRMYVKQSGVSRTITPSYSIFGMFREPRNMVKKFTDEETFEIALSEAFDLDPDKLSKFGTFKAIRDVVDIYDIGGVVVKDSKYKWLHDFIDAKDEDLSLLIGIYDKDGSQPNIDAIHAAIELRKLHLSKINNTEFKHTMTLEADAISSGPSLQNQQIGITEQGMKTLERTGIMTIKQFKDRTKYVKVLLADKYGVNESEVDMDMPSLIEAGKYHTEILEKEKRNSAKISPLYSVSDISNRNNENFIVEPINKKDNKAIVKSKIADYYIGIGTSNEKSSTAHYGRQAGIFNIDSVEKIIDKKLNGKTIFVSVNGKRGPIDERDAGIKETIRIARSAIRNGAILITDTKEYANSSSYNIGEKALSEELEDIYGSRLVYQEIEKDGVKVGTYHLGEIIDAKQNKVLLDLDYQSEFYDAYMSLGITASNELDKIDIKYDSKSINELENAMNYVSKKISTMMSGKGARNIAKYAHIPFGYGSSMGTIKGYLSRQVLEVMFLESLRSDDKTFAHNMIIGPKKEEHSESMKIYNKALKNKKMYTLLNDGSLQLNEWGTKNTSMKKNIKKPKELPSNDVLIESYMSRSENFDSKGFNRDGSILDSEYDEMTRDEKTDYHKSQELESFNPKLAVVPKYISDELKKMSDETLGKSFDEAFKQEMSIVSRFRDEIKKLDVLHVELFKTILDDRVKKAKLLDGKGRLTLEAMDEIFIELEEKGYGHTIKQYKSIRPLYKTDISTQDNSKRVVSYDDNGDAHSTVMESKSYVSNMGAAPTTPIHGFDGEGMRIALKDNDFTSVYDAIIFPSEHGLMQGTANVYNKGVIAVSRENNMMESTLNKMDGMIDEVNRLGLMNNLIQKFSFYQISENSKNDHDYIGLPRTWGTTELYNDKSLTYGFNNESIEDNNDGTKTMTLYDNNVPVSIITVSDRMDGSYVAEVHLRRVDMKNIGENKFNKNNDILHTFVSIDLDINDETFNNDNALLSQTENIIYDISSQDKNKRFSYTTKRNAYEVRNSKNLVKKKGTSIKEVNSALLNDIKRSKFARTDISGDTTSNFVKSMYVARERFSNETLMSNHMAQTGVGFTVVEPSVKKSDNILNPKTFDNTFRLMDILKEASRESIEVAFRYDLVSLLNDNSETAYPKGSDIISYLDKAFDILNTPTKSNPEPTGLYFKNYKEDNFGQKEFTARKKISETMEKHGISMFDMNTTIMSLAPQAVLNIDGSIGDSNKIQQSSESSLKEMNDIIQSYINDENKGC